MRNKNSLFENTSRYVHGGVSETQNGRLEWWERTQFAEDATDQMYTVEKFYEGRLDLIASVFYNDPHYWWVIAQFNNILDPASEIVEGRILRLPTYARLSMMLTGKQGGVASKRINIPSIPPVVV